MVLEALDLWDVVDPNPPIPTPPAPPASSSPGKAPSTLPPDPVTAEWAKKNKKALSLIGLLVEDTPIKIVKGKLTAKDAWKALAEQYNGVGALDALILMSCLHKFQLDDSKSLESQINQMCNMHTQLATLGDEMMDPKFAMIIAEALPPSYKTLKTLTVAMVSDVSQFASNTLIIQILQEENTRTTRTMLLL